MDFTQQEIEQLINQACEKGLEYYKNNENDQAEAIFSQILCVDPDNIIGLQMLGLVESKIPGKVDSAISRLKRAELLDKDNADIHNNFGLVYSWSEEKNMDLATKHYLRAIELKPDTLHFYSNLGIHYKIMGQIKKAEEILLQGLTIEDASTMLHFNYATLLGEQKRWVESKYHYYKAIDLDPDFASAHYNLSTVLFNIGNLEEGWKEYEWRWDTYPAFKRIYQRFPQEKRWDGKTDPSGKTFLVYAEQGMGDTIQFSRFIKTLRERCAKVILEEHTELVDLMKTLIGPDQIIKTGEKVDDFDLHCSVVSLPYLLNINNFQDIPNEPYLHCNYKALPDMSILYDKYWNTYTDVYRIGIIWGGNPVHQHDRWRSTFLQNFKILQQPGVKLFSLQKDLRPRFWPGIGEKDLTENTDNMSVVDMKDFLIDYNATAAIIDRMDLVISVDTATAHLAAAMGKPVWLLVSYHNDWRWLAEGKTTDWYPTMRLFRQPKHNDWESVFEEVSHAINKAHQNGGLHKPSQ